MSQWHLRQAAHVIHAGGIVAYPTEAVYGLGCDPFNAVAVLDLLNLKQRAASKGLILIAANIDQLDPFLLPVNKTMQHKLDRSWPGPVTWLLPARPEVPYWLRGSHASIAVRVTDHPLASALCNAAGMALVSTSANISTHPPARTALDVQRVFRNNIDYILHGATGGRNKPSEIRDGASGKIIRSSY